MQLNPSDRRVIHYAAIYDARLLGWRLPSEEI